MDFYWLFQFGALSLKPGNYIGYESFRFVLRFYNSKYEIENTALCFRIEMNWKVSMYNEWIAERTEIQSILGDGLGNFIRERMFILLLVVASVIYKAKVFLVTCRL